MILLHFIELKYFKLPLCCWETDGAVAIASVSQVGWIAGPYLSFRIKLPDSVVPISLDVLAVVLLAVGDH